MAEQNIYTGATGNDGTGDKLRVAFNKVNHNFDELYTVDRNTANSVGILSNNTSDLANSVNQLGAEHDVSANVANIAFNTTNAAFGLANSIYSLTNVSFGTVNSAYSTSNAGFAIANSAFNKANDAYVLANNAYNYANTIISENTNLSDVFGVANAAFNAANNIVVPDISTVSVLANGAFDVANAAFGTANNIVIPDIAPVYDLANAAFDAANNVNISTSQLSNNGNYLILNASGITSLPNSVTFGQNGYYPPDIDERSGEKVILWDQPGFYSYSIGIETDNMWFGVDEGAPQQGFKWYTGNTKLLHITRQGNVAFSANGHIFNRANSSGDGYGYDTLEIYPDSRYTQGLIIDPTAPSHIHLRGTGDQDNSVTDLFIGGENYHFKIPAGVNPAPVIRSNNYSWSFYDDGGLQFPDSSIQYTAYSNVIYDVANAAFGAANNIVVPDISFVSIIANDAFNVANAAFGAANNIVVPDISLVSTLANDAFNVANAAFGAANNSVTDFSPAFNKANDAYVLANNAYNYANTIIAGNTDLSGVYNVANAAFDKANSANLLAYNTGIGANNYAGFLANTGRDAAISVAASYYSTANNHMNNTVNAARDYTNTSVSSANAYANTVGAASNNWANTVLTSGTSNVALGNVTITYVLDSGNFTKLGGTEESFGTYNSVTGVTEFDCTSSYIFYVTPTGNFTANLTNFTLDTNNVTSVTFVLNQGVTPYMSINNLLIGAANLSINWQGGTAPTGTASKKDILTLSILNVNGANTVLGQLVSFG